MPRIQWLLSSVAPDWEHARRQALLAGPSLRANAERNLRHLDNAYTALEHTVAQIEDAMPPGDDAAGEFCGNLSPALCTLLWLEDTLKKYKLGLTDGQETAYGRFTRLWPALSL